MDEISEESSVKWNYGLTKLLITCRLKREQEFKEDKRKKCSIWKSILLDMKTEAEEEINFSVEDLMKKYHNIMITYRRIKQRNKKSGRGTTAWVFFEELDKVYGCCHFVQPPNDIIYSTMRSQNENMDETNHQENLNSCEPETEPLRKRAKRDELLDFLKEQENAEQSRHEELIKVQEEKNELDSQRIKILSDIRELLQSFVQ